MAGRCWWWSSSTEAEEEVLEVLEVLLVEEEDDRLQRSADSFLSLLSLLSRPGPWTAQSLHNYF